MKNCVQWGEVVKVDCGEAEQLFDRYLDREVTLEDYALLRRHLGECPRCADNWLATLKTADLLAASAMESPGPELLSRVMMSLPKPKPTRGIHPAIWRAAAAVLILAFLTGAAYLTGYHRMSAAFVENRDGQIVVVPKPGTRFVIPPGAVVMGDLKVEGDAYIEGKIAGHITIKGKIKTVNEPRGFWEQVKRRLERLFGSSEKR